MKIYFSNNDRGGHGGIMNLYRKMKAAVHLRYTCPKDRNLLKNMDKKNLKNNTSEKGGDIYK